jgi:hypothetical protein
MPLAPTPGEIWTVASSIENTSGTVIEHSRVPVLVLVLRQAGRLLEVAPVSFETHLAGPLDAPLSNVFGRPAMAETWLRMPVTPRALQSRALVLPSQELRRIESEVRNSSMDGGSAFTEDDPRRSYRQDERLRVIFAMAGTGEEIELPEEADSDPELSTAMDKARRLKRGERRPTWRPQPEGSSLPPGYAPGPSGSMRSLTPPKEPISR